MKKVLLLAIVSILSLTAFGQKPRNKFHLSDYGVEIKPDKRLILIMASLEIAGMKTNLDAKGKQFRKTLDSDLAGVAPEIKEKIRSFVNQYRKRHPEKGVAEVTAPFISLAYSLTNTPELEAPDRSVDLPDDLLEVLDFAQIVKNFYKSPGVASFIDKYFKTYSETGDLLQPSAESMVRDLLDYLHTKPRLIYIEKIRTRSKKGKGKTIRIETVRHQRNFSIVPELLASKGAINFLNIRDNYYAVVSPETNLRSSEVRRAYLQFVLDPLVLEKAKEIAVHRPEIKKLLDERRKNGVAVSPDVLLAISRSIVAAVDIREEEYQKVRIATNQARNRIDTKRTKAEKTKVADELRRYKRALADDAALELSNSYENGAVLAFYFARKLRGTEDAGFDIANSLGDWISSLDPKKEKDRLEEYATAKSRAVEKNRAGRVTETTLAKNPVTDRLIEIDKLIAAKKFIEAETQLKTLLNKNPDQARIFYALGEVVNLSAGQLKDPIEIKKRLQMAITHYSNAIRSVAPFTKDTPDADRAWASRSYFALGRIYEFYEQNAYALKIYEAALSVGRVRGGAYGKALKAKQKLSGQK